MNLWVQQKNIIGGFLLTFFFKELFVKFAIINFDRRKRFKEIWILGTSINPNKIIDY